MPGNVLRQHVGDEGLIPAPHLVDPLLLVMDIDLPEEEGPGQLLHLWVEGYGCTPSPQPPMGPLQCWEHPGHCGTGMGLGIAWKKILGQGEALTGDMRPALRYKWDPCGISMGLRATMLLPTPNHRGEMKVFSALMWSWRALGWASLEKSQRCCSQLGTNPAALELARNKGRD